MSKTDESERPMSRPWSDIVAYYEEGPASGPSIDGIATVARHIRDTRLSEGLFGWKSMLDLCITQTVVYHPYDGPYLRISPAGDRHVEFRYIDTRESSKQWHRSVPADESVSRLHRFLMQMHWFSSVPAAE